MKNFLIVTFLVVVFNACSTKNAFTNLQITSYQEKSEENTQSSKIKNGEEIDGLVTAIYLNGVDSLDYKGEEYFYIYLYTKSQNKSVVFMLNGKKALNIEELKAKNIFSHLNTFNAEWSRYFLVSFEQEKSENLSLQVKNTPFSSNKLLFKKAERD